MAFLSIIIPVYNKEKYLDECLQSILAQTYTDFELILVNDGSTDSSGLKCEQYKNTNPNIVVLNQENQGVSAARNKGIEFATGEYIGFIDADDKIEGNMYEILVKNALNTNSDISICRIRQPGAKHPIKKNQSKVEVFDRNQGLLSFLKEELDFSANNRIYKKEIAKQIRFEGRMFEDVFFTFQALSLSKKNVLTQNELYHYLLRDNSVSISKFSTKYLETVGVTKKILNSIPPDQKELAEKAKVFDLVMNLSLFNLIVLTDKHKYKKEYEIAVNNLDEYSSFVKNTKAVKMKHKAAYTMYKISPSIYSRALKLYLSMGSSLAGRRI